MILQGACLALELIALSLSLRLAGGQASLIRLRREFWRCVWSSALFPLVTLCAFAALSDITLKLLQVLVLTGAPKPFTGGTRIAYLVATSIWLAWPAQLAAMAWRVFGGTKSERPESRSAEPPSRSIRRLPSQRDVLAIYERRVRGIRVSSPVRSHLYPEGPHRMFFQVKRNRCT